MNLSKIPQHMHEGVRAYVDHGQRPGSFLWSILCNDLVHAAAHADVQNRQCLFDWACLLYHDLPIASWGSAEQVEAWIAHKGREMMSPAQKAWEETIADRSEG